MYLSSGSTLITGTYWKQIMSSRTAMHSLHHEQIYGFLDGLNERGQLLVLIRGHTRGDDGPGHAACPAQSRLGSNEDVLDVLRPTRELACPAA